MHISLMSYGCNEMSKTADGQVDSESSNEIADASPVNVEYESTSNLPISELLELRRMTTKEIDAYLTARSWIYGGEQKDEMNYGNQVIWTYSSERDDVNDIEAAYIIHTDNKKIISNNYIFNNVNQYHLFQEQLKEMDLNDGRTLSDEEGTMIEYTSEGLSIQLQKNSRPEEPKFALMLRPIK